MSPDLDAPGGTGHEAAADPAATEAVSVYEAIGGHAALVAAVGSLYARLLADPDLSPLFPRGVSDRHQRYFVTILGEALGGPERYRGPGIEEIHRSLAISDAQFDGVAAHLIAVLSEMSVPGPLAGRIIETVAGLRPAVVST